MVAKTERGDETIGGALAVAAARLRAAGVETARLDAEVLLAEILGVERWRLVADAADAISPGPLAAFQAYLGRREAREPVAYILGRKEFWSLDLAVSPDVLIPRPETECLVEAASRWLSARTEARGLRTEKRRHNSVLSPQSSSLTVVDVGTGPGTILLAVASEVEGPRYIGTDVSPAALGLARRNAMSLGLAARVELVQGDLLEPLAALGLEGRVDLLISNPPYVSEPDMARLAPEVRRYEPGVALRGGPDGLEVIRRLIAGAPRWLAPSGALLFEFGDGQANECLALLRASGVFGPGCIVRDLGGWPRAALAPRWSPKAKG
jgi:release factor glutamine methyltransferase